MALVPWDQTPEFLATSDWTIVPGGPTQYNPPRREGIGGPQDVTSFHPGQANWSEENMPDILYVFRPPPNWAEFKQTQAKGKKLPPPKRDANGNIMYERWPDNPSKPRPLLDFKHLPDQVGSQEYFWVYEAWRRYDPRIRWKDILMRQMNTDKKERSKNAQGNNINMMVGRGRDRYKILTWDVDERRKNHVDWLDQMTDQQKHHNTTRGLTPGLIDPALGEQPGNRIPIPPSIAGAGLQKTMVGRRRQEKAKKDQELTQSRTRSPEEDATATNLVLQAHVQKAKERRARSSRKRTKAPADRSNLGRPSDTSQSQGQPDAVAGMTETPPTNADYLPEGHLDYTSQFEYGPTAVTQSSADPWQSYPHAQPQQVNVPISPYTTEPNVSYGNQSHAPPRSSQPRTYADAVASGTMHGRNHTWQLAPLDQRQQFNAPMGSYMGARGDQHLGQSQFAAGPSPQIFYSTGPALQNRHRDYARTGHSQQFYTSGPAAVANMGQVYDFPWDGTQQFYHYQQPQQFQQSSQYYPLQQHHLHQGRQSQYPRQPQHSRHLQHPQYSQQDRHPPYPQQPQQRQSSQHPRQPLSHQPTAAGHQQPTRHPSNRPESRQLEHQQRVQQLYEEAWARESGQNDQYAPPSERR